MNSSTACQTRFCLLHSRLVLWRSRSSTAPAVVRARSPASDFLYPPFPKAAIIRWKNTRKNQHARRRGPKHENRIPDPSVDGGRPPPLVYTGNSGTIAKATVKGLGGGVEQWRCAARCVPPRRTDTSRLPENKLRALFGTASSTPPSVRVKNASHTSRLNSSSLYYHRIIVW